MKVFALPRLAANTVIVYNEIYHYSNHEQECK